jgi:hypothetical protein
MENGFLNQIDNDYKINVLTKNLSKKEKKAFEKCIQYEKRKNETRNRLRKKLEEKNKKDW